MFLMIFNVRVVNALESNVSSKDELVECIEGNGKCIMSSNFEAVDLVINQKNVTIDLNGKTLSSNIKLENKANFSKIE